MFTIVFSSLNTFHSFFIIEEGWRDQKLAIGQNVQIYYEHI